MINVEKDHVNSSSLELSQTCRDPLTHAGRTSIVRFDYAPAELVGLGLQSKVEIFRVGPNALFFRSAGKECGKIIEFNDQIRSITIPDEPIYAGKNVPFSVEVEDLLEAIAAECNERNDSPAVGYFPDLSIERSPNYEPVSQCSYVKWSHLFGQFCGSTKM